MTKKTQDDGDPNIIAESEAMRRVLGMVDRVALAPHTSVLIHGESGTGKGLIARRIHCRTPARSAAPIAAISCASLSESSMESELFGYEKNAAPDAKTQRRGLLEAADGGTLFLDEIGEMHPGVQGKLMKILEQRTFRRLGGTKEIKFDARIVAATNKDLAYEVRHGRFRLDLYHRLNVFNLRIPPLRERRDDIVPLANDFLIEVAVEMSRPTLSLNYRTEKVLRAHHYPGNVRELRNLIERAVILSKGDMIGPSEIVLPPPPGQEPSSRDFFAVRLDEAGQPPTLDGLEAQYIARLLAFAEGNRTKVARLLGVSYPTVVKKMADYRLSKEGR